MTRRMVLYQLSYRPKPGGIRTRDRHIHNVVPSAFAVCSLRRQVCVRHLPRRATWLRYRAFALAGFEPATFGTLECSPTGIRLNSGRDDEK